MLDRVERLCASDLDAKALRERVLAAVRPVVPFDGHVWVLTDPVTCVGTAPLADLPGLAWPDLPGLVQRRYLGVDSLDRPASSRYAGQHVPDRVGRGSDGGVLGPVRVLGVARPVALDAVHTDRAEPGCRARASTDGWVAAGAGADLCRGAAASDGRPGDRRTGC